jgi:hypothetical protein
VSLPTPEEVRVATAALRSEANLWDEQAGRVSALAADAAGMEFGRLEAGLFQMMVGPYNDVIRVVSQRCNQGSTAMTDIAATLRRVADTYEAEDAAGAHRITNIY